MARPQSGINRLCNRGYRQSGKDGEVKGIAETEVEEERVCRKSRGRQSLSRARVYLYNIDNFGSVQEHACCTAQVRPNGGDDLVRLGGCDQLGRGDSKSPEDSQIPGQEPVGQTFSSPRFRRVDVCVRPQRSSPGEREFACAEREGLEDLSCTGATQTTACVEPVTLSPETLRGDPNRNAIFVCQCCFNGPLVRVLFRRSGPSAELQWVSETRRYASQSPLLPPYMQTWDIGHHRIGLAM